VTAAGAYRLAGTLALAGSGPQIGRGAAQQLARRELSKAIYQPSLTRRFLHWLGSVLSHVNVNVPGGWWALITVIAVAVLVIAAVIFRIRPGRPGRRREGSLLQGAPLSARDHRQQSERLAAAGDFAGAIIERVRTMAVWLEEREVLPPGPGRTADELAADAGRALPAHALALADAAQLFDDVMYGGRGGTDSGYQRMRELDASLQSARPTSAGASLAAAGATGPAGAAGPGL